jgi:hypothetical protein
MGDGWNWFSVVKPHAFATTVAVSKAEFVLLIGCGNSNFVSAIDDNQGFIYSGVNAL